MHFYHSHINRRHWLRIGGLGLPLVNRIAASTAVRADSSMPLPAGASETGRQPVGFGRAKSVIVVFASGGQSQLETWDPKPDAPLEIRGEFGSIATSMPSVRLNEYMPRIAKLADRLTIVRSMSHEDLDHGSAFYLCETGHYYSRLSSNPLPKPTDQPPTGAILKRVRPESAFIEPAMYLNGPAQLPLPIGAGQFGGFLGREFDPLTIGDVTAQPVVFPGLKTPREVSSQRMLSRRSLLAVVDDQRRQLAEQGPMLQMDARYRQAFEMLDRPETRDAFDLRLEPMELRQRYGMNRSGQSCLLARRMVEAGVPLVTVIWNHSNRGQDFYPDDPEWYGWDTHNDIFATMRDRLLPRFDISFSALIEDLDQRGLLDETLVICMGEFGRAPLVAREPRFPGSGAGRKHWAAVYSIVFAGAGVGHGQVIGASDRHAAWPVTEQFAPWDVQATVFSALGIDPSGHYEDPSGRPYRISSGRVMESLYAG